MAEARVTDIASELKTLQLLKTERISSYWRYARVGRMLVNFPSVWRLLLQTYCIDNNYSQAQTKRTQRGISTSGIGLTHIDDPRLRQASEEDALLMVKCLIHHVQCDRRYHKLGITAITRLTFNAKEFYINASNILNMLHLVHDQSTINTIKRGGFDTFILRRISYIRKGAHVHTNIMSELLSLTSLRYRPSSSSPINSDVCAEAIEMLKQRIVTSAKKNPLRLRIRKDNVVQALGNIRLPTKHVNSRIQLRVPLRYTGRTASNFHNVRGTSHSNYSDSNHHSQSIDEYVPNYVQKHISLNDNNISLHDKVSLHISTPHVPTQADINPLMEQRKGRREEHSSLTDIGLFDDRVTENIPFGAHDFPPSDLNICVSDQNRCTRTSNKPICMACTDMTWRPWLTGRSTTLKGAENLDRELLNSLSIPSSHRGNVFLNNDCLDYMRHSAWYSAARALWDECGITNPITKLHLKEREDHGCVITSAAGYYFSGKKSELFNRGYCILTGLADHDHHNIRQREFNTCTCATCHFNAPNMWPSYSLDDLYKWVYGTFLDYFVDSGKMKLWTSIINTGDKDVDAIHRQEGKARYISTTSLVVDKMENKVHVWTAVRRAFLDTWVCMLLTMMDITERGMYSLSVPASGGRFLITGREAVEQVGHNDFIPKEGKSPGFFAIVTGKEAAVIYVCPGSHLYIHYSVNSLRELAKTLEMVPIDIPAYSIFVAHGAVQHAGAGWNGSHSMRYHLYLVPNGYQLPDGVHFAYDAALKCTSSRPTVSLPT